MEDLIDEDKALDRLKVEFSDLSVGRVEGEYHRAVKSDNVRLSALILSPPGVWTRQEWRRVTAASPELQDAIDLRLSWSDLLCQVRQQLGSSAPTYNKKRREPELDQEAVTTLLRAEAKKASDVGKPLKGARDWLRNQSGVKESQIIPAIEAVQKEGLLRTRGRPPKPSP